MWNIIFFNSKHGKILIDENIIIRTLIRNSLERNSWAVSNLERQGSGHVCCSRIKFWRHKGRENDQIRSKDQILRDDSSLSPLGLGELTTMSFTCTSALNITLLILLVATIVVACLTLPVDKVFFNPISLLGSSIFLNKTKYLVLFVWTLTGMGAFLFNWLISMTVLCVCCFFHAMGFDSSWFSHYSLEVGNF